jgi:thioredoxin-like negative regulator of GroEL
VIEQLLNADRLLSVDQVDQAEAVYQRVADSDPLAAMAVVGLARCALARGQDRRAHALAARALAIDPEDDMARRMEARLAEVLALRGEPVERPPQAATTAGREMRSVVAGAIEPPVRSAPRRRGFLERIRGR